jgi:hypothetical protein
VNADIIVSWDLTPCRLEEKYESFRKTCCLLLQKIVSELRETLFSKTWIAFAKLYEVTS